MRALAAAIVLAWAGPAQAQVWFGAEAPFAFATSDTQRDMFEPGFLPAAGVYAGSPRLALGLRVRAGFLSDGSAPASEGRKDPGTAGLVSTTLAARVRVSDAWLETAAGGGLTGRTLAPTFEVALGWTFARSKLEIGPSARYVRVVSTNAMDTFGTADLVLVGLDMTFGASRARAATPVREQPADVVQVASEPQVEKRALAAQPAAPPPVVPVQVDDDRVADEDASCIHDLVGCTPPAGMEVQEDRIILDERVLFDFDRARVRTAGRKLVHTVVEMWKAHPTWTKVTIEGHTDVRGSDAYNVKLGELRANRVRDLMLELGAPSAIDVVGVGRARPRDTGHDEAAHSRNRRVEFVIERSVP